MLFYTIKDDFENKGLIDQLEVTEEEITEIFNNSVHADENVIYIEPGFYNGFITTFSGNDLATYELDQEKIINENHYTFNHPVTIAENTVEAERMEYISFLYTIGDEKYAFSHDTYNNVTKDQYLGKIGQEGTEEYATNLFEFMKLDNNNKLLSTYAIEGENQCDGVYVYTCNIDYWYSSNMTIIQFYNENGITHSVSCAGEYPTEDCNIQYKDHTVTVGPIYVGKYNVMRSYEITEDSIEWCGDVKIES